MATEEDRERAAREAAQMHRTWRIQVNTDIAKDTILHKNWLKLNKVYREVAGTPCFFQVMDKTKFKEVDWADTINIDIEAERLEYHCTDTCNGFKAWNIHHGKVF